MQGQGDGPIFGGGFDLAITTNGGSQSYCSLTSYTDTLGRGWETFTGKTNFTTEDYEVWAVAT
jgi:hypothetical protein